MIINAVNTQKIPNAVAFKGSTPLRIVQDDKGTLMTPFTDAYVKNMYIAGLKEAGTDVAVLDDADNAFAKLGKFLARVLCRPQEEANAAVLEFAKEKNIGPVKEVIKEVPASTAQAAAKTATEIPWKKYGPIAAIAAVAVGVTAFFIGKAAEKKRQEKLNGESEVATTNQQPQPVLQEIAKKPDTSIENFFSAPQATAKT